MDGWMPIHILRVAVRFLRIYFSNPYPILRNYEYFILLMA
jgi:hypothetical protein